MWQEMSNGDQEKRSRASREKATKLRSPNFYISTTRLSLRNLPYTMDERALKTLVVAAVRFSCLDTCPSISESSTPGQNQLWNVVLDAWATWSLTSIEIITIF